METLSNSDTPTLVSNIEVMQILSQRIADRKKVEEKPGKLRKQNRELQHRDWIEEKVLEHIQSTPCTNVDIERMPPLISALRGKRQKPADSGNETKKEPSENNNDDKGFGLTDAETLQIINFMPQESVEIHLMVEDLHSRMTEERQEELLTLVGSYAGDATASDGDHVMQDTNGSAIRENGYVNGDELMEETKIRRSDIVMKEEPP